MLPQKVPAASIAHSSTSTRSLVVVVILAFCAGSVCTLFSLGYIRVSFSSQNTSPWSQSSPLSIVTLSSDSVQSVPAPPPPRSKVPERKALPPPPPSRPQLSTQTQTAPSTFPPRSSATNAAKPFQFVLTELEENSEIGSAATTLSTRVPSTPFLVPAPSPLSSLPSSQGAIAVTQRTGFCDIPATLSEKLNCEVAELLKKNDIATLPNLYKVKIEHPQCSTTFREDDLVERLDTIKTRTDVDMTGASTLQERRSAFATLDCPAFEFKGSRIERDVEVDKYRVRAGSHRCENFDMWGHDWSGVHKCVAIMSALGKLGDIVKKSLAPGSLVFDWGCGCGHKAAYWKQYFDADTLGIDAVQANIEWARQRIPGAKFCQADGAHIEFLPSKLFDLAFSMAGVYHLEHAAQCEVLHEMCRSVRPGGLVVIVWHGRFKYQDPGRGSWKPCMDKYTARKTKLQVMDDVQVFGRHYMMQRVQADIDSGKADRGDELFTTYSIVVQMLD